MSGTEANMLRSTTALINYARSSEAAEDIPEDGTCEEAQEALYADFAWITNLPLELAGPALGVEGSPRTEVETAEFKAFIGGLFERNPGAVGSLLLEDEPDALVVPLWLGTKA